MRSRIRDTGQDEQLLFHPDAHDADLALLFSS